METSFSETKYIFLQENVCLALLPKMHMELHSRPALFLRIWLTYNLKAYCKILNILTLYIYLNAKVSQLLLKCYFLLFEPNILLHDIVINKSNNLPSKQHENQTSEIYDCRSSTRNVRQPKFEKSQSYIT